MAYIPSLNSARVRILRYGGAANIHKRFDRYIRITRVFGDDYTATATFVSAVECVALSRERKNADEPRQLLLLSSLLYAYGVYNNNKITMIIIFDIVYDDIIILLI